MNKTFLETERILLTELNESDSALLQELDSDSEVMRYISNGKPSTPEEVQAAMARILKVNEKHQYKFGFWLAYTKSSNEFIGWFHFRPGKQTPENTNNIELGYRIKQKFWKKGYATEVSKALIKLGFEEYGIDSVFAITMKENLASQSVMKKVGMSWVGDYIENEFPGHNKLGVRYEIKKQDWKKD